MTSMGFEPICPSRLLFSRQVRESILSSKSDLAVNRTQINRFKVCCTNHCTTKPIIINDLHGIRTHMPVKAPVFKTGERNRTLIEV